MGAEAGSASPDNVTGFNSTPSHTMMKQTYENLEQALAGESMAYIKYMWFAKIAKDAGYQDVAEHFEWTASQEIKHAWGHLELLHNLEIPSVEQCLQMAIEGETYEFTTMYPEMEEQARLDNNSEAAEEARAQILESEEHAYQFTKLLDTVALAERRFAALKRVEQKHAEKYETLLESL